MQVHPEHDERGIRSPELEIEDGKIEIFVDQKDLEDGFLRLKGLCNVKVSGNSAEYMEGDHKEALEKDAEFIHWAPGYADEASVRMPDGETIDGRIEPNEINVDEVVQFERFGFVRCDSEGLYFFAHE